MKKSIIEKRGDIRELIKYLLPANRFIDRNIGQTDTTGQHLIEILIETLWADGQCMPLGIDALCRIITERKGWEIEDKIFTMQNMRDRLLKRKKRINDKIKLDNCPGFAYIKYDKSKSKFQLIIDPKEVQKFIRRDKKGCRLRGMTKEMRVDIIANEYVKGTPVLSVGDVIRCRITTPISGYPHLFHVDANKSVDKLFPSRGAKKETVRFGEVITFPKDLLKEGFWWKVGVTTGKDHGVQQIVAVVSRLDIKVTADHLKTFGVEVKTRGAVQQEPSIENIKPGGIAFGCANYEMRI